MTVEFVDRYSATGTPTPNGWTVCRGDCEGLGVYPMHISEWEQMAPGPERPRICPQKNERDEWDFPPEDGLLIAWCEICHGTGRRSFASGRVGRVLDVLYTYYYALYWPLWAATSRAGRGFYG